MHFKQKISHKERWIYILSLARIWSEITILIGFLLILYIIIKQIF